MGPQETAIDQGFWAMVGLKLGNVLAGAAGAFVSLRFFEKLSFLQKWTTFMGGWALAAYGGAPLTAYFELKPSLEVGITLVVGLFGMSLTAAIIKAIQETNWGSLVAEFARAVIRRVVGDPGGRHRGDDDGDGRK